MLNPTSRWGSTSGYGSANNPTLFYTAAPKIYKTVELTFGFLKLVLRPHFDIETKNDGAKYPPGITADGDKYYFTNDKGERQQLSVVTASG